VTMFLLSSKRVQGRRRALFVDSLSELVVVRAGKRVYPIKMVDNNTTTRKRVSSSSSCQGYYYYPFFTCVQCIFFVRI
jgi:hypothetical protein